MFALQRGSLEIPKYSEEALLFLMQSHDSISLNL